IILPNQSKPFILAPCLDHFHVSVPEIGGIGHVGWGQDHMGRSGRGHGYCSCVWAQEGLGRGYCVLAGKTGKGTVDGENLDKMKEKGDECIFVGYSNQSRAYRVFNKRTRVIMESIHVNFDELPLMASDQISSDPAPEYRTVSTSNELDLLFSPMFDELLNGSSKVVSKSSVVSAADAPNQRQQHTTSLNTHTTPAPTCQALTLEPTVTSSENINQAETYTENDQVADDEFINIFSTPIQDQGETSSLSRTEPKNIKEAMVNSSWIESMQEELHQFERLDVWELVDRPLCTNVINLKWLWKNKCDEENTVI
nr:hypothetical protein [Tanacetum cinerariifolium]